MNYFYKFAGLLDVMGNMLKGIITKLAACVLVLWYAFCIIGFDVHTCKVSDSQFVSTFLGGFTCQDIHPEHHCSHCAVPDDFVNLDSHETFTNNCCCSNLYHNLELTGSRINQEQHDYEFTNIIGGFPLFIEKLTPFKSLYPSSHSGLSALVLNAVFCSARDVLSSFSIWRI